MIKERKLTFQGKPEPQARARTLKRGITYDPKKDEKNWLKMQALSQWKDEVLYLPLEIIITFHMPIPKQTSKSRRALMLDGKIKHSKKPDFDNLAKLTTDAMEGIVYGNDSQIYKAGIEKIYAEELKTVVTISWDDKPYR